VRSLSLLNMASSTPARAQSLEERARAVEDELMDVRRQLHDLDAAGAPWQPVDLWEREAELESLIETIAMQIEERDARKRARVEPAPEVVVREYGDESEHLGCGHLDEEWELFGRWATGVEDRPWREVVAEHREDPPRPVPAAEDAPPRELKRKAVDVDLTGDEDGSAVAEPPRSAVTEPFRPPRPLVLKREGRGGARPGAGRPNGPVCLKEAKNLFLTWPQCDTKKEVAIERLLKIDGVLQAIVGEETHKSGEPHLHAHVVMAKPRRIPHAELDAVAGKHGNYQVCARPAENRVYVTKGENWVARNADGTDWDPPLRKSAADATAAFVSSVRAGETRLDLLTRHASLALRYWRILPDLQRVLVAPASLPAAPAFFDFRGLRIPIGFERHHRQQQYWLYGPPGVGKSFVVQQLLRLGHRGFQLPRNNDFAAYDDSRFDFIFSDELNDPTMSKHPPYDISSMNSLLDGSPVHFNVKGGSVAKNRNLTVLLIANIHPSKFFKAHAFIPEVVMDAVLSRLTIVRVDSRDVPPVVEKLGGEPSTGSDVTAEQREAWESSCAFRG